MKFCLVNLVFLLISFYAYFYFRCGILSYCSTSKMSKSFIRKNKKGAINYWLYKQLHQQRGIGGFYYINYVFLIGLSVFLLAFIFSWIKWMRIPVAAAGLILGLIEIPALIKALVYSNLEDVGRKFVLFRVIKGCNGKSRRFISAFDWLLPVFPLTIYLFLLIKVLL